MTKLDDILDKIYVKILPPVPKGTEFPKNGLISGVELLGKPEAKAALKAVMLEIVGEDEPDTGTYKGSTYKKLHARNKLRAELREEIEKL